MKGNEPRCPVLLWAPIPKVGSRIRADAVLIGWLGASRKSVGPSLAWPIKRIGMGAGPMAVLRCRRSQCCGADGFFRSGLPHRPTRISTQEHCPAGVL